jgi:hypothetical protein
VKKFSIVLALALVSMTVSIPVHAQSLLAMGQLTQTSAGFYTDLSGLTNTLENGDSASLLGGLGSGLAYASGDTFLALPDRGPNAVSYDSLIDDTVTYIPRFHAVTMGLTHNTGSGLPFILTPTLTSTTLLYSVSGLDYGNGSGLGVGTGVPPQNTSTKHYFTGRSDAFDPSLSSGAIRDGRLDTEGIRVSKDGTKVYISDEYGPYVYEFDRATGARLRAFSVPANFFVPNCKPVGNDEIADNTIGRTANKGMEGLAITPDGKTLVGIMQNALIQDAAEGGDAANLLRIVLIDIASGRTVHQYAYLLTTGSGVSEITAINQHQFLVDERDGKGLGDDSKAKIKQIFKIDLAGAVDVSNLDGTAAAAVAVSKTLFLDVVAVLTANGITSDQIPAKLEGLAIGPDVNNAGVTTHTLWMANDNDFEQDFDGPNTNPNQFFVFGFTNADLGGAKFQPQQFELR